MDKYDRDKLTTEETYLLAPCGIYCGACDILLGRSRNLATEMHRIVNGFNIADVGPFFMGIEQEKIVDFLNMLKTWTQVNRCPGCLAGGGNPSCPIRACSQQRGFLTCAECDKMPCYRSEQQSEGQPEGAAFLFDLVTRRYANWNIGNLERIREVGYRRFVDEMQDKVKGGLMTSDVTSSEMVVTEAVKKNAI